MELDEGSWKDKWLFVLFKYKTKRTKRIEEEITDEKIQEYEYNEKLPEEKIKIELKIDEIL